jgi:PEGA domain
MLRPARSLTWRRSLHVLPFLAVCLVSGLAAGQDQKELSRARALFQQAIELEQAGNDAAALQKFREVGQVRMTPQVRFHIATCEAKLGKLVTALGGYELALAAADGVGGDFKSEVEQAISRLRARIPKIVIQRGEGAETAAIELDGIALGGASIGVPVPSDPGAHGVNAKAPGFAPFSKTITVAEGEQASVIVTLTPLPLTDDLLASGPGSRQKTHSRVGPYVVGGIGVASLIGSGVLFALRASAISDLDAACKNRQGCPSSSQSTYDRLRFYNTGAQVTLGIGVTALGAAVTWFLVQKRAEAKATTGLTLSAPGALAGASFQSCF